MKRRLLQVSLDLATEIHAMIDDLPENRVSEKTDEVKTLSLAVQSHLTRAQTREGEEEVETLKSAVDSLHELEEKMLEAVKIRNLRKMAINPLLAQMEELEAEIKLLAGIR